MILIRLTINILKMGQDVSRMSIVMNVERLHALTNEPKPELCNIFLRNFYLLDNTLYINGLIHDLEIILTDPRRFDVNDATYCDMQSFVTCYKDGGINRYFKRFIRSQPDNPAMLRSNITLLLNNNEWLLHPPIADLMNEPEC